MARSITERLARGLLDFVLPPVCLGCRRLRPAVELKIGLCPSCRGRLEPVRQGCLACGRRLEPLDSGMRRRCGGCLSAPPSYDELLAGWCYQPPFDQVIRALKFGHLDFLGAELAQALATRYSLRLSAIELVVPVPLHWRRRLVRGYNQATEIARPLAGLLGAPSASVLHRRRFTRPQSRLPRAERASNVQGCFVARHGTKLGGRRVLLVDDVATTGATLQAAAEALRRAGTMEVVALVAGRTPEERDWQQSGGL